MKKNKYNNNKIKQDGYTFDSQKEHKEYCDLKLRHASRDIVSFTVKPRYILQPKFKAVTGETLRQITYTPDFELIHKDGTTEIVDVKGMRTEAFDLKWKMIQFVLRDSNKKYKFTIV